MVRYLDSETDFGIPARKKTASSLASRRQKNGQLPREQALEAAREQALRVLDRNACSSAQIQKKLSVAGFEPQICEEIVNRLLEVGLLNDREYAAMLVRTRFSERGLVGRALIQELNRKGIPPALHPQALAQIDAAQQDERVKELAEKKARTLGNVTYPQAMRRLASFLARKGYSPAQCREATHKVLSAMEFDED